MTTEIFENALVVTASDMFHGYVVTENGLIAEVGEGGAPERGLDLKGDYLLPGLIEIHTDNLEAHFLPRPKVLWQVDSAVQAYDGQIATSGITTVFDSLRVGTDEHETRTEFVTMTMQLAEALERARAAGLLRVDHRTHLRCEVPTLDVLDALEAFIARYPVDLISLMDHTPGQRQFRDLDKYFIYYGGKTGKSMDEVHAVVSHRQRVGFGDKEIIGKEGFGTVEIAAAGGGVQRFDHCQFVAVGQHCRLLSHHVGTPWQPGTAPHLAL
jgi:alpha-D-ribose 1-methylphosphonate 5-triphosphate diphosphatase